VTLTSALIVVGAVGLAALALAEVLARHRRAIGSLRRQALLSVAIAVGLVIVTVIVLTEAMVLSRRDGVVLALVSGFAGLIGVLAGRRVLAGALDDVDALRDGLVAVGEGRRDIEIASSGRDELAQLATEANAMIGRLRTEEAARRSLIASVSHDLRTPMTSLRLLASAVEDGIGGADERERYLATMRVHVDALSALIDDLFELSRIEAGDLEWSMERVALCDLVAETVEVMRPQAGAKRIAVITRVGDGLAAAHANPEKVQRVLFNLLQNAIRHTPPDGSVTVLAESAGDRLEVEVADTGCGIPEADRVHVFDALTRGDAARSSDGAGLGLAISRAIVEAHGGRIWLPEASQGTRIRFSLRCA
jgi:signal transduction histidine kinase